MSREFDLPRRRHAEELPTEFLGVTPPSAAILAGGRSVEGLIPSAQPDPAIATAADTPHPSPV